MKIGSHNTFTYLPVRQWWLKPIGFMAKCQSLDIWKQYQLGIRLFDLRVRFTLNGKPILCHGYMEYDCPTDFISDTLHKLNKCKGIYVRVILEINKENKYQEDRFIQYCKKLELTYENIKFFEGRRKFDFKTIYKFKNPNEDLDEKYSSVTSFFKSKNKFLKIIDDWFPWIYAKLNNKKNLKKGTTHKWFLLDFVNIR